MLFATLDIRRQDYNFPLALKMITIWRQAAPILLHGDYYPLDTPERSPSSWVAWQFDQPEAGQGLLQAFRLPECPQEAISVTPRGLDPNADYRLENQESGECMVCSAATLLEQGFTFRLPRREAAIWFYRKIID
jgi:alpha-galactosidase